MSFTPKPAEAYKLKFMVEVVNTYAIHQGIIKKITKGRELHKIFHVMQMQNAALSSRIGIGLVFAHFFCTSIQPRGRG